MKVFGDDEVCAATVEETKEIMVGDPGVQSGVFVDDVHACMGFPGDAFARAQLVGTV